MLNDSLKKKVNFHLVCSAKYPAENQTGHCHNIPESDIRKKILKICEH